MGTDANERQISLRLDLTEAERILLVQALRTMWSLHIDSQIHFAATPTYDSDALQEMLHATDERLLEIRALAGRLGAALFSD